MRCYYGKPKAPKMTGTKSIVLAQQFDDGAPVILSYPVSAFSEPFDYAEDLSFYETESGDIPAGDYASDLSEDDYVESFEVDISEHSREKPCGCQDKTLEERSASPASRAPTEAPPERPGMVQSLADDDLMADIHSILSGAKQYDEKSKQVVNASPPNRQEEIKPLEQKSEHQIFDKLAQSMRYANAYDLGAISLQNRFDAFDKQSEQSNATNDPYGVQYYGEEEAPVQKVHAPARPAAMSAVERAGVADFVEDLDVITRKEEPYTNWSESETPEDSENMKMSQSFKVPAVSLPDIRKRLDAYLDMAKAEYTLPGDRKVRAYPQFRYGWKGQDFNSEKAEALVRKVLKVKSKPRDKDDCAVDEIRLAAYGRAKPSDVAQITQALIDAGEFDKIQKQYPAHEMPSDIQLIRELQSTFGIGIDCAGYVQRAFIYAFTLKQNITNAERKKLGLKTCIADENLYYLDDDERKKHFDQFDILHAREGDLIILKPRSGDEDNAKHTLIVVEHTNTGNIHKFIVDASWGTDAYSADAGGVGRRTLCYDNSTKEWWDIHPIDESEGPKNMTGPYLGHPLKGVFRARQQS